MSTTQSAAIGIIGGADGPTAIFVASNSLVPQLLSVAAALAIGYLLGSLMFGIIVSKGLFHDDVRSHGSGNAGSTNILRTYGKGAAALALAGDMGKGVLAVFLARWAACLIFGLPLDCAGAAFGPEGFNVGAAAAFAALLGHMKPLYFGFKGGKGVLVGAVMLHSGRCAPCVCGAAGGVCGGGKHQPYREPYQHHLCRVLPHIHSR